MWQEFSNLRAAFVKKQNSNPEKYRQRAGKIILYEILKLTGNKIQKQAFIDITQASRRPHTTEGLQAYDLWKAFLFIEEKAIEKTLLNLQLVRTVAAKIMKHTGGEITTTIGSYDTSLGDFRLGEDYDEIYPISDFRKIPNQLEALCRDVNARIDKVQGVQTVHLAADFMYEFAHIKPFGSGNLETGLLLMNYIQMYHGEPFIVVFAEDRPLLLNALKRGEVNQSPTVFENFVASEQIKLLKHASFFGL